jgi:hypothetical protein
MTISWTWLSQGHYKSALNKNLDLTKTIILSNNNQVTCELLSSNKILLDNTCGGKRML